MIKIITFLANLGMSKEEVFQYLQTPKEEYSNLSPLNFITLDPENNVDIVYNSLQALVQNEA